MVGNYRVELWGVREIGVEGGLWVGVELVVDLHSSVATKKGI